MRMPDPRAICSRPISCRPYIPDPAGRGCRASNSRTPTCATVSSTRPVYYPADVERPLTQHYDEETFRLDVEALIASQDPSA